MEAKSAWEELGLAVRRRRQELGLTMLEAALRTQEGDRHGISDQTWSGIEKGDRGDRRRSTLSDLCWALRWTEDSATRILEGLPPVELNGSAERSPIEAALEQDKTLTESERRAFQALLELVEHRRAISG